MKASRWFVFPVVMGLVLVPGCKRQPGAGSPKSAPVASQPSDPRQAAAEQALRVVFQRVLERAPRPDELTTFSEQLLKYNRPLRDLVRGLASGTEYEDRFVKNVPPEEGVRLLYLHLLNREPENEQVIRGKLEAFQRSYRGLVNEMLDSVEAKQLWDGPWPTSPETPAAQRPWQEVSDPSFQPIADRLHGTWSAQVQGVGPIQVDFAPGGPFTLKAPDAQPPLTVSARWKVHGIGQDSGQVWLTNVTPANKYVQPYQKITFQFGSYGGKETLVYSTEALQTVLGRGPLPPAGQPGSGTAQEPWQTFSPRDRSFTILLPPGQVTETANEVVTMFGPARLHRAYVRRARDLALFGVLYCDFASGLNEAQRQQFLKHRRDAAVQDHPNAKLVKGQAVTVQGCPGLDYATEDDVEKVYTRTFFLNNTRQIELFVQVGKQTPAPEQDIRTLFDSVKIP